MQPQARSVADTGVALDVEVQGGAPIVRGTRITVESVAFYWRAHEDVADVQRAFPQLTDQQIAAAIAYYQQHRGIIDAWLSAEELPA